MAALTASQAPGAVARASAPAPESATERGPSISGDTPFRADLPPLRVRDGSGTSSAEASSAGDSAAVGGALPATVFAAYRHAESELARSAPGCSLRWQLLAAIGQVESGQARGGRVTADGTTLAPILGPRLDGNGFALIRDSDGGAYDGDTAYDRAVGPMQFIPSTWASWGADGNGDGRADPHNIFDAALAAGRYLCAGGRDLSGPADLDRAILGYNHSRAYLRTVRAWLAYFLDGHRVVPDKPGASDASPKKKPSETARPETSPAPSRQEPRPGGSSGAPSSPAPTPSSPSPSPSKTRPAEETREPVLPLPDPTVDLPGDGVLTGAEPLASNGKDSMSASPSTTPDTGR
ncbi:lytic transglycosylase domain-containing protein [Streptomyces sp. PSKA54]|uniref:Lytic transglycosylase domain-containing protein n=2 Tax=Streptomyces TaxID=1883 RepID=A0A7W2D1A1_9ACTN|nr:lytic transglycosylase domain-containing protein [Streptomyces himalayensis subsp. aureolus]